MQLVAVLVSASINMVVDVLLIVVRGVRRKCDLALSEAS